MKRSALAPPRIQPLPRASRKSEWLRSALAQHHCPDPGVDNEIVVLATGIDQYLQEVFHHLAFNNRDDTVSAEDFIALCTVLGLTGVGGRTGKRTKCPEDEENNKEEDEFKDVCSELPCQLSFKDFHSRLCGYFRVLSALNGAGECSWRLPVSEDTELVENQIRLRWPRARRRKCVSFDLAKDQSLGVNPSINIKEDREADEVWALRELVEDLRSALQGSDARCLALEVVLRRERSRTLQSTSSFTSVSSPRTSITFREGKLVATHRIKGQCSGNGARRVARRLDIRDPLLRELKLIRSSRDGQLEEAMKFNEHLEDELRWAYQEVRKLQGVEAALRKENAQIRRRAEDAREALSIGLQRVRLIQEQAQSVPQLQSKIYELETELQQYRSCCQQVQPIGAEDPCSRTADAECLQRAVEGKAASDEEEEDIGLREEGQCCLNRLHCCGKGTSKDSRGHCCKWRSPNQDQERSRGFERVKNVSRRVLGNIVTDTLDVCSGSGDGTFQVLQVADSLCIHLSSSDLLGGSEKAEGGSGESRDELLIPSSGHQPSSVNPLLISC